MLKKRIIPGLSIFFFLGLFPLLPALAWGSGDLVKFPENYAEGVLYTTVYRGNIREDIYAGDEMHRLGIGVAGIDKISEMSGHAKVDKHEN
ncbi:hypothetical protein [uncultured Desulfuromusa sp.]|uniref:hypothetical protein n=1 Tax=uncultured Desulfuromusa sp. TaxID=219183 RepID=UPI002AA5FDCE|nr:hypothetical protein [uncultured Desulfuromusa sp.]